MSLYFYKHLKVISYVEPTPGALENFAGRKESLRQTMGRVEIPLP
jgi:hypothetical protein